VMKHVKTIAKKLKRPVGVMLDLQGPSIRLRLDRDVEVEVKISEVICLSQNFLSDKKTITLTHPQIISHLQIGARILVDDGTLEFEVVELKKDHICLKTLRGGVIKPNKSVNLPGVDFDLPILTERDILGLDMAQKAPIDFVAMSFVRSKSDIEQMRIELEKRKIEAKLISKIETVSALQALEEIIEASDAVMVARGDLGVEANVEQVPYYQKKIINFSRNAGKPVITATQMLQSMMSSPVPTRAEVSDVATAVFDRTDAVMLSGESASGNYPIEAVSTLRTVSMHNENFSFEGEIEHHLKWSDHEVMVVEAGFSLFTRLKATNQKVGGFLVFTRSGRTARLLASMRARTPIFAYACNALVRDQLQLVYGVVPFDDSELDCEIDRKVTSGDIQMAIKLLQKVNHLSVGDNIIVLHGDVWNEKGGTSTVKVVEVS